MLPLLLSASIFGLVHTEFVEPGTDGKDVWFKATAAYGVLYGILYVVSGHQLLAPVCAHAGINFGLCMRDWKRMRATPDAILRDTFEE